MDAGTPNLPAIWFSGKLEKTTTEQEVQIYDLPAKIGQLSVERDFLVYASNRLGVGGGRKY